MELGIGKFLEMFEERFGQKTTTGLLALIGLAVATLAISTIAKFIKESYDFIKALIANDVALGSVLSLLTQICIMVIIYFVIYFIFSKLLAYKMKGVEEYFESARLKFKAVEETHNQTVNILAKTEELLEESKRIKREAEEKLWQSDNT